MKIRNAVIFLLSSMCLSNDAKSQRSDTLFYNARVVEIDTIDYYVIVRALSNEKRMTILSPLDEKNKFIEKCTDSSIIKAGVDYRFVLLQTARIKGRDGNYFLLPLKNLYYGSKHLLNAGELPYLALNMYGFKVYH
jgi:hypothetical protein